MLSTAWDNESSRSTTLPSSLPYPFSMNSITGGLNIRISIILPRDIHAFPLVGTTEATGRLSVVTADFAPSAWLTSRLSTSRACLCLFIGMALVVLAL